MSDADKALYERAKQSGNNFSNREEATASFRKKYGEQYKTTFTKEPPVRPNYVPKTYTPENSTSAYPVTYNADRGAYGYWTGGVQGLGTFLLYDALSDAAITNSLMEQKGYYYGPPPVSVGNGILAPIIVIIAVIFLGIIITGINSKKGY